MATAMTAMGAAAETITFTAVLDGKSEAPPVTAEAHGSGEVTIDPATRQAQWKASWEKLSGPPMAAHIHCGAPPGGNAGVALTLRNPTREGVSGAGAMTAAQIAELLAGNCYFNIHTAAFKSGEIRGQLSKAP